MSAERQSARIKQAVVLAVIWVCAAGYFYINHIIADGIFGPFRVVFCTEDGCGIDRFSFARLMEQVARPNENDLLTLVMAIFLANLICLFVWGRWYWRRKNES